MTVKIIAADVMDGFAQLEDNSVHCVVTSPPYWGLRDYGVPGQLGLEPTLGEYIETMVRVFREVRRVLRKDGTLWLNLGDCYGTSINGRSAADTKATGNDNRTFRDKPFSTVGPVSVCDLPLLANSEADSTRAANGKEAYRPGHSYRAVASGYIKPKDLCGVPWRIAFALQADGWWLRQDIIWSKSNPMPESIKDRCTKAHEYIFLLTKAERYYYDADAIAEPAIYKGLSGQDESGFKDATAFNGKHKLASWGGKKTARALNGKPSGNEGSNAPYFGQETRNKRSVWEIATSPFPEAHFATFPPALPEICIKAGCPKDGTVLDPFGGAGTTGLVADRWGRNAILIELNPEYAAMAERRIKGDCPMFAEVG